MQCSNVTDSLTPYCIMFKLSGGKYCSPPAISPILAVLFVSVSVGRMYQSQVLWHLVQHCDGEAVMAGSVYTESPCPPLFLRALGVSADTASVA